jgi:hypothetical protein
MPRPATHSMPSTCRIGVSKNVYGTCLIASLKRIGMLSNSDSSLTALPSASIRALKRQKHGENRGRSVVRDFPLALRRLLLSDILIAQTRASGSHPHAHRSQRVARADREDWDHEASIRAARAGTASCGRHSRWI